MLFEEIIGNNPIKTYLKNAIKQQKLPHTLLFSGPEGIGKSLFAKALALAVMYPEGSEKDSKKIDSLNHPDFHLYQPEGKVSLHNIASMRSMIELVHLAPFEAGAKFFVISDADRMQPAAANALLKTLEEPDSNSYIILVTSKEEEILPTILSRTVKLNFLAIEKVDMVALLQRWGKTKSEAHRISLLAHGSIERASEIASFVDTEEKTRLLLDLLSRKELYSYLELAKYLDKISSFFNLPETKSLKKHKEIELFLSHILMWYRDLHLLQISDQKTLFFFDHRELLKKELSFQQNSQQSLSNLNRQNVGNSNFLPSLEKVSDLLDEARRALSRNIKLRTVLEHLFLQLDLI